MVNSLQNTSNTNTHPSMSSSSHPTATTATNETNNNKILDSKRLRFFSGDDTIFVVKTNNNDEQEKSIQGMKEEDEEEDTNNTTIMMLMMLQQQQQQTSSSTFSPSSVSPSSSPSRQQHLLSQSVWHVSNIINLHLPGLLWSDPESSGKWQRWLLRAIPEMVNLTRLDVRDGQMGDLWCRALVDALTEQKMRAAHKKASLVESSLAFSPRVVAQQQQHQNHNQNQDIFVMHLENNFLTQQSIQHIGRFLSTIASSMSSNSTTTASVGGFLVELYLQGNPRISDHGAQMLAAHAVKAASVPEVGNRVVLRFLDISGCDVGGRGLGDLMTNCGTFCDAIICEGWRHYHEQHQSQLLNPQQRAMMMNNNQQPKSLNPPTVFTRDAMRNIPTTAGLRVVDLSGCGYHRLGATALNVLLPALLVCCPRLRALGLANTIRSSSSSSSSSSTTTTKPSELMKSLIDSLTSICRSCQRAPALEFIDLSGCHISDQNILKLIEFITRERARERAVRSSNTITIGSSGKNKGTSSSTAAASVVGNFLNLRIIDVSDGEVLDQDDQTKAPITISAGNSSSTTTTTTTQLHVRSSLGKDAWRAIMLAVAMEDDSSLTVISESFITANNKSKSGNNDDSNSNQEALKYIQQVIASPSSRYAKNLKKQRAQSASSVAANNINDSSSSNNQQQQQQQQRSASSPSSTSRSQSSIIVDTRTSLPKTSK